MPKLDPAPFPGRDLAAQAWIEVREPLDRQLSPLGVRAIDALSPRPGETIVDIGCGTGQTALQLAARVAPPGRVIGVDISPLVLDVARERARDLDQVSFIAADAATLDLAEPADGVFSRFGVMAFADPAAAFANLRRMLRPGGRLAFVCWRSLAENALDLVPLQAAGLGRLLDPTPFSLEDPDHIRATLAAAGFRDIALQSEDHPVTSGDLDAMAGVLLKVGALGRILRENPSLRDAAEPRVRAALASKADGAGTGNDAEVYLTAAIRIVTAQA